MNTELLTEVFQSQPTRTTAYYKGELMKRFSNEDELIQFVNSVMESKTFKLLTYERDYTIAEAFKCAMFVHTFGKNFLKNNSN